MKKKIIYSVIVGVTAISLGNIALAHEDGTVHTHPIKETLNDRREINKEANENIKDINAERRDTIKTTLQNRSTTTRASTTVGQIRLINSEAKEKIKAEQDARKAALEQNRLEFKNKLIEARKGQITAYTERTIKRMEAALERLKTIMERIHSRITKMKDGGADTSKAEAELSEAEVLLENAGDSVAKISTTLTEVLSASSTDEARTKIRESIKNASDDIKDVHKALSETVREIKSATTTSSN